MDPVPAPLGLLAELTHRCPLGCPYCSNPLALEPPADELDTAAWSRVFREAAALGVLQVHLSGGEPGLRPDLAALVGAARAAGLYTNLITSAVSLSERRLGALVAAGLDHIQISIQDSDPAEADRIAHRAGAFARKREIARAAVRLGLPLTVNCVIHRGNIGRLAAIVALAAELGADRVEIAHAQYHGWALANRAALMPTPDQITAAGPLIEQLRDAYRGRLMLDAVMPDHHSGWAKPCLGGWGRRSLNVTPTGLVLPCHAAQTIPGLVFWSVRDHSLADIWRSSPAFAAFRGTAWMREPCASCARREHDFGGCRCQAFALTGDAQATDPACRLSPDHAVVLDLARSARDEPFRWRA
ncbi:pyrroloquinoline quinone biosynthesis protein PqqE [Rhodoplanes serenus]|nr:pyrroloquinoline quinone biosynthesis protein PqqE [Rhodoplanes serenus]RAI33477.1 pyrroloquinoline quinone biosynthesis protein PqqE [Rhodoplanes serenus]